jgi:hypothetical protein
LPCYLPLQDCNLGIKINDRLQELIERRTLFIEGYKLPDPFYWDLWGNLEHLRNTYTDCCTDEHFDPAASEKEESVASFDTQA